MDFPVEKLINLARAAKERAYAPYSGFHVGAAVLTEEGRFYSGCNVENASFGLTVCAERVSLLKAVSNGERIFTALALISDKDEYCCPCGACLQVMAEFSTDMKVCMCNDRGDYIMKHVYEMLPDVFRFEKTALDFGGVSPRVHVRSFSEPVER